MGRLKSRSHSASPIRNGYNNSRMNGDVIKFEKNFYKATESVLKRSRDEIDRYYKENNISASGDNIPKPVLSFDEIGFPSLIMKGIKDNGWERPTPIQSIGWPMALSGNNVVGIAQTGSGKTASFLLPGLVHIKAQVPLRKGDGPICLIMVPTRELAQQVEKVAQEFSGYTDTKICSCYGGSSRRGQKMDIERTQPEIIVATPGRLIDYMNDKVVNLKRCTYLVLDEADRMLDMGFEPDIRKIVSQIRDDRQTLMWSATWPTEVQDLAKDFLGSYLQVNIGSLQLHANPDIEQRIEMLDEVDKESRLIKILKDHKRKRTLVFAETKRKVDEMKNILDRRGIECAAMHGDKAQREREKVLDNFRTGRCYVLVATDVASRGLDIDDVEYVINYDYPSKAEDYVHRIGRTGRSGKKGVAYTFINPIKEKPRQASSLIKILEEAKQKVPEQLRQMSNGRGRFVAAALNRRRSDSNRRKSRSKSRSPRRRSRSPARRRSRSPIRRRSRSRSVNRRRINSRRRSNSRRRKSPSRSPPRRRISRSTSNRRRRRISRSTSVKRRRVSRSISNRRRRISKSTSVRRRRRSRSSPIKRRRSKSRSIRRKNSRSRSPKRTKKESSSSSIKNRITSRSRSKSSKDSNKKRSTSKRSNSTTSSSSIAKSESKNDVLEKQLEDNEKEVDSVWQNNFEEAEPDLTIQETMDDLNMKSENEISVNEPEFETENSVNEPEIETESSVNEPESEPELESKIESMDQLENNSEEIVNTEISIYSNPLLTFDQSVQCDLTLPSLTISTIEMASQTDINMNSFFESRKRNPSASSKSDKSKKKRKKSKKSKHKKSKKDKKKKSKKRSSSSSSSS